MRYHIQHQTEYQYDFDVTLSQHMLHMTPRLLAWQSTLAHQITISPNPSETSQRLDYFGNSRLYFSIYSPHQTLSVISESTVEVLPRVLPASLSQSPSWEFVKEELIQHYNTHIEAQAFLFSSPKAGRHHTLANYAAPSFTPGRPLLEAALDLTQRIYQDFEFDDQATSISTPLSDVLAGRRGVCQDFAHLMIACLRSLGLACRYVSGYILTTPPEGQERMIGADASHAWASVYCPDTGWVDFDPTNNCLVQTDHITVAWGRDFSDISPMRGVVLGGGAQQLDVSVTVTPIEQN
ncbi:transglutaminase family protein [Methylovorus glucosotrophus]|uniref:Transglutaminase domain protein n=1 Tax=Methylovorus glucosotrophus (strain SIP3-4) TaxID=582744 RepID=C6X8W9_METGS|nr:transglutaminase family protein [Methylovorus glucosotrophus]ACT49589.1 transglutaminase domain protein [Methylovorus glucosotrophus SIP3-4]